MTSRRGFLKGLFSSPLIAVAPKDFLKDFLKDQVIKTPATLETVAAGVCNGVYGKGIINTGHFAKALWPGVNAWFAESYNNYNKEGEWDEMFELQSDSIGSGSDKEVC